MPNEERLREFMETYEACFGKPIAREDATLALARLMAFIRQVSQPLPSSTRTESLDSGSDLSG